MRIWIDATCHDPQIKIFGMTLLERLLRSLLDAQKQGSALHEIEESLQGMTEAKAFLSDFMARHLEPTEVRIELAEAAALSAEIPESLIKRLPITLSQGRASRRERLAEAIRDADGEPLLAFSADTVVDVRLIEHLIWATTPIAFVDSSGGAEVAAFRIDSPLRDASDSGPEFDLAAIAKECLDAGIVKEFAEDDFEGYIKKLRRTLPAFVFRVDDAAAAAKVEHFLFWSNYKGATDFLTRWVFPPLVWRMVRPLAKRRVKPNTVTGIGIICCFAAVPFFALGWWIPGLLLAYTMAVLDSVDGKLARLTFTSSAPGDVLDHGTDVVHPPIWYWAWAWGLSGGDPYSPVFQASVWMFGLYIVDRVLEKLFKSCTGGRSVQDYKPLDVKLRTFVSRRNVNLAIFTFALPFGLGSEAFFAVVGLQLATVVYHLIRVIQFWDAEEREIEAKQTDTVQRLRGAGGGSALSIALAPIAGSFLSSLRSGGIPKP